MKKLFSFILILFTQFFYAQWVQQVSGVLEYLNDVYCITENIVVVVGSNGTILKTTDGGTTWMQKTSGTTQNLNKVQFANTNVGYTLSLNGTILKTIDSGENWNVIIANNIYDFSIVNESIFYYSNFSGELYKTTNGGNTFQLISATQFIKNIKFINQQIGFEGIEQLGAGGNLRKTIDGGITWSIINTNSKSFSFVNENIGFIITNEGLFKTIDGGVSFIQLDSNIINGIINKLFAVNENIVWGIPVECLLNGSPCYSSRGEILNTGTFEIDICQAFKSIYFASQSIGYGVVGESIYKNSTGLLRINEVGKQINLKINPNPATNQLNISFNEIQTQPFVIEITDNLGKKIFSNLYNNENNIIINTNTFSKGIYFLSVLSQELKQTQKIIIN